MNAMIVAQVLYNVKWEELGHNHFMIRENGILMWAELGVCHSKLCNHWKQAIRSSYIFLVTLCFVGKVFETLIIWPVISELSSFFFFFLLELNKVCSGDKTTNFCYF